MLTTLIVVVCTSAAMDDCQAYAEHQWNDTHASYECLASIEPTLDALRREGLANVGAYCEVTEDE